MAYVRIIGWTLKNPSDCRRSIFTQPHDAIAAIKGKALRYMRLVDEYRDFTGMVELWAVCRKTDQGIENLFFCR